MNNRYLEIDFIKGLGIILMIMGHQYYGMLFDIWIHSFHMPIFFMISGFLFNSDLSIRKRIHKKYKSLIIPYITVSLFHLLIFSLKIVISREPLDKLLYHFSHILLYNHEGIAICGAVWFLTALFFTDVIYSIVCKITTDFFSKLVIIFTFVTIGHILSYYEYRLPLSIDISFVCLGLYFIGDNFKKIRKDCIINFNGNITMLLFIISLVLIFRNGYVNLRLASYGNIFLFYIDCILMGLVLYIFSVKIVKNSSRFIRYITNIGRNSLIYLSFNQLLILLFRLILGDIYNNYLIKLILLIVILYILESINNFIENNNLKFLFGK